MAKRSIPALSRTAKDCARNREGRRLAIGKLDALLSSRRLVQRVSDDQPHGNSGARGVGLSCGFSRQFVGFDRHLEGSEAVFLGDESPVLRVLG